MQSRQHPRARPPLPRWTGHFVRNTVVQGRLPRMNLETQPIPETSPRPVLREELPRARSSAMVQLREVAKSHRRGQNEIPALRGVSAEIAAGSFTFILGPSGSGKSSLLYLIGAL